jgi:hypothetical protein
VCELLSEVLFGGEVLAGVWCWGQRGWKDS